MQIKAIPGYQYYYASTQGDIFSITPANKSAFFDVSKLNVTQVKNNIYKDARGNEMKIIKLKQHENSTGYLRVSLSLNGRSIREFVHRLVLITFRGPFPAGKETNHKDGNPLNNKLSNLEFVTRSENIKHALQLENKRRGKRDITKTQPGDPF